ncbi:MAG: phosphoglycerate dehydrogenase [Puniceicoccaceae bacterium]
MFQILVADKIAETGVEFLRNQKEFEVIEAYGSTKEEILNIVPSVSAIVVRSETQIDADVIAAAPLLKAVGRAGVGVDNIDLDAATERGIVVVNTPGGNTIATAELTMTHLLCSSRPIAQADRSMKQGNWDRKSLKGVELKDKTLAVLGLGRIGAEVAARAQAFGMTVIAYDPFLTEARAKAINVEKVDLDEVWARADYITVHMPLTDKTRNMVNRDAFAKMKQGVRLVNCARGGLIHEQDLIDAIESGKVSAAGLDVFEEEPLPADHPFRKCANLVLTPHLGASTEEAQYNVGIEIAEVIARILKEGVISNAVNVPSVDAHTLQQLRPYFRLGQILGTTVQQLTPDTIQRLQITYYGRLVELDTMPLNRAIQKGYLLQISGEEINDVNAGYYMKRLGIEGQITKSSSDTPYSELIQIEAILEDGSSLSVEGTVMGRNLDPRIVSINGRDLEVTPRNVLMLVENKDMPGMVGMLGTILGKHQVNIANMTLNRREAGQNALVVFELDQFPSDEAVAEITSSDRIVDLKLVDLTRIK